MLAVFQGGDERMAGPCAARARAALAGEQDRVTGDFSRFWCERDYLHRAGGVRRQRVRRARAQRLERQDQGLRGVVGAAGRRRRAAQDLAAQRRARPAARPRSTGVTVHRWFDRWLFGVPQRHPRRAARAGAATRRQLRVQPPTGRVPGPASRRSCVLGASGRDGVPARSARDGRRGAVAPALRRRGRALDTDDVLIQIPDTAHPNRLVYRVSAAAPRRAPQRHAARRAAGVGRQPLRRRTSRPCSSTTGAGRRGAGHGDARLDRRAEPPRHRPQQADPAGPRVHASASTCSPTTTCSRRAPDRARGGLDRTTTTRCGRLPAPSSPSCRRRAG